MNVRTRLSGHISGQVPTQPVQQVTGPSQLRTLSSQMQSLGNHAQKMDTELLVKRRRTQEYIIQLLQRKNYNPNAELMQRIPEIAKRLEERIYRDAVLQGEDYKNMSSAAIDQSLQGITRSLSSSQQQLHYIPSSSVSTMIPTPGMTSYGNKVLTAPQDNTLISTGGDCMMMPTLVNTMNMSNSNGLVGMGQIASCIAPTGTIPNQYQQPPVNTIQNSGGNGIISSMGMGRQSSQMIPTPGLNNQQSISINPESSGRGGFSRMDPPIISQQQHKQYDVSQNNHLLHDLGIGVGVRSNIQQKISPYSFHNVVMSGGMGGLVGSTTHHMNGPTALEGYLGPVSYGGSPKSLHQHLDKQKHQSLLTASISQQILPLTGDGYAMNTSDLPASGNIYGCGSTAVSTLNSQNSNLNLNSKSKTNHVMLTQTSLPSAQHPPQLKPQTFDISQTTNFQVAHSARELLQSQQQMQNFQHQKFPQSNQPSVQLIQNQRYQPNQQHQQHISNSDNIRQSSMHTSLLGQMMPADDIESTSESFLSQRNEQFRLSELQNQYDQNTSLGNLSKSAQLLDQIQGSHDVQGSSSQATHKYWEVEQHKAESRNELSCLFARSQIDTASKEHWYHQSPQKSHNKEKLPFEKHMQEEFHKRMSGKNEAQPVEVLPGHMPETSNKIFHISIGEHDYFKQMRWLLLLLHSRKCPSSKGQCREINCSTVQQLWMHIDTCNSKECMFPRCSQSRKLFNHHMICKETDCPVCIPVKEFIASVKTRYHALSSSWKDIKSLAMDKVVNTAGSSLHETSDGIHPSSKRMRVQNAPSLLPKMEASLIFVPLENQVNPPKGIHPTMYQQIDVSLPYKTEIFEVRMDTSLLDVRSPVLDAKLEVMSNCVSPAKIVTEPCSAKEVEGFTKKEMEPVDKVCEAKLEINQDANIPPIDPATVSKSVKSKIKGVSLTELFTVEQVRDHIIGLRQWIGQSKAKAEKNQAMECSMSENSCQLCAVEKLTFDPPPIYCTLCGSRIKRNAMYYTAGTADTRHYFCIPCYNEARCDTIEAEGFTFPKSRLEKKKNDEEIEEWWVQCDKCEAWQHQICALFNGKRNEGGQAEYTCPNCCMEEIERGERKPLPQNTVLGAKDLPRTILSDYIEQRLFRRLKHERQERARHLGKSVDEVPGAEALVVRVVSSIDKKLDVKQRFLEIFQEENYPAEFQYKSKVILLFQKIEGVEVCLFGMYVQEFGSECQLPNQRRVYLSYLDSVKYFRPEIRTVTGEALRTFVYHEILIGYLDYCKKRGFTSCYIWACPPLKGEDYILYCHPEIQKTPKSDKLREWYLSMLRKAIKETIVVGLTNLYDHFFVSTGECKAKVTAVRLPYFDGDYWPGAAEDMINQLRQEEDGRKQQKKGKTKMTLTKRALKAAGHTDLGCIASKDAILMQKLGETISPMKEDFIMVHLQHACTQCCTLMVSGNRWVCHLCKHFQICDKCYEAQQNLEDRDRHPVYNRERHDLFPIEIAGVLADTKDKDENIQSEFFDTRQAFLSLCQGNHYQYDTLRRAKHSSMMALYHLHNPTAPAFVTTCNVCCHDIETGQGWRCEVCPDFDVCNGCYQRDGGIDHAHKLTNHPSNADRDAQSQEARQKRFQQLQSMLDLLVHASLCRSSPHCLYSNCRKVKGLFRHGIQCKIRASRGCVLCKKMWYLLQLHSRDCKESGCIVPRCKDLKEHMKRLQHQAESRRRIAVMEMVRQRATQLQGTDN